MRKRWGLWVVAVALGLATGWRVASVVCIGQGSPAHDLHWIVYGYDRVWYRDRAYVNPGTIACRQAAARYGSLTPTGAQVTGLPVLAPAAGARSRYVPTVLMLQQSRSLCTTYALSGGP